MLNKSILVSINTVFAEQIYSGKKIFELRRRIPLDVFNRVVMYEANPVKMVTGEFQVSRVIKANLLTLWCVVENACGVNQDQFMQYFKGLDYGYAISISRVHKYDEPLHLSNFGLSKPPQSFIYLKELRNDS